jgi:hypothetical protein
MTNAIKPAVSPEVLFIERCVKWLKPGGRAGVVLPDGILGNPGDEYIRYWILRHCWVLASIDLPVESFIVEANVNILTSLLFLKRKPEEVIKAEDLGQKKDYPVFMAVAEKVGFDRRGNTLYRRHPDGEEILVDVTVEEKVRIGGRLKLAFCIAKSASSMTTCPRLLRPMPSSAPNTRSPANDHSIEATRYRCFERLGVDVGDFQVLVGANGSGKTTLLDLPVLLGDLLRANNVSSPFMERRKPPRVQPERTGVRRARQRLLSGCRSPPARGCAIKGA